MFTPVSDSMKSDVGEVHQIKEESGELQVKTPAGIVTYHTTAETRIVGENTSEAILLSDLKPGQEIRVYYFLDGGAQVCEIHLKNVPTRE
jgi:hypothetical protein